MEVITFIKNEISFTEIDTSDINTNKQYEHLTVKVNISKNKNVHITNIYLPPKDSNNFLTNEEQDLDRLFNALLTIPNNIITGDINAHSNMWFSSHDDQRGKIIANIIDNSNHTTINTNTNTRVPFDTTQNKTSPDVTILPIHFIQILPGPHNMHCRLTIYP